MPDNSLAVLVGNGLSIAFNPALGLGQITTEVVTRMSTSGVSADSEGAETAVSDAMKRIADRYSSTGVADHDDFENIVGAFGGQSNMLRDLRNIADLVEPDNEDLTAAIKLARVFARKVRDAGITHVLEVIFEQSRAHPESMDGLHDLSQSIIEEFEGTVTFGNLNYDTLLLSALLHTCQRELADLGHGWRTSSVTTGSGDELRHHQVNTLRRTLDFPDDRRVRLLHLHGSLTFWGDKKPDSYVKLDTTFIDAYRPWNSVRSGNTKLRPAVVLANQKDKSGIVQDYPFNLAYSGFSAGLAGSDSWLVIGYSFRDIAVNELFELEMRERTLPPRMLVVTMGDFPKRKDVEIAVGWDAARGDSRDWLTFDRSGAFGFQSRSRWDDFKNRT